MEVGFMSDWMSSAACQGAPTDLFFQPDQEGKGGGPSWSPRAALTICHQCPVIAECRKWAIDTGQAGVWGGMTEDERRRAHRRATRGHEPSTASIITVDDEATRERMYRAGDGDAAIGKAVGRTADAIKNWRDHRGYPANAPSGSPRLPIWVLDLYASLYESGWADQPIADLAGTTVHSVRHWRRRQGHTANPPAQKVTG